jgi:murein DD-endopeptidase MepM/ murein hydrolase activator NlpD
MTPERRFMLLDGIVAPGKANGRSVASVVENRVIGIAGNSLIMPVAPGNQLDPTIDETFDLFAQYYHEEHEPMRISIPTKGIYAEAVMGQCNSCEEKDESRFWRWEESPIPDSPTTQILPIDTSTRRADPGNLQPKDLPTPMVNIQNAPDVPDPAGLQAILQLLGKGDAFRDLTGLNQNQLNALAAFQKSLETAQSFGKEAAELAKAAAAMKMVEDAKNNGTISNEQAREKGGAIIDNTQKDPNARRLQESMELIDQLEKEGKISAADSSQAKNNLMRNFLDSSNAKTAMSNAEIQNLADAVKRNNADISVERPGEKVEIKKQPDPAISGTTVTNTLANPTFANHEGLMGMFKLIMTLNPDASFKVEFRNDSFDFLDVGPLHANNESNITLRQDSPKFGDLIPCNPRSTSLLYEGSLNPGPNINPFDLAPKAPFPVTPGIKTDITRSNERYALPFRAGLRIPCVQGRNVPAATHHGGSRFALDFGVPRGTEVLAAMEGTVVDIVRIGPNNPIGQRGSGADNIVRIRHLDMSYGIYGHLNPNDIKVTVGQRVAKGTLLALSGNSGPSNGDHLHFAVESAKMNGFETIDFDFYDKNGHTYVPDTNKIFEAENGLVGGKVIPGTGDPENNIVGDIGDVFVRVDGTPGNLYYVKESGSAGSKSRWVAKSSFP